MIAKIPRTLVGDGFVIPINWTYYSPRYNRNITIHSGFYTDGATGAFDIDSDAWVVHDHICRYGKWDDGTKIDNWTASTVLGDILWEESKELYAQGLYFQALLRKWRSFYWWWATYLFGGGAARINGMRRLR